MDLIKQLIKLGFNDITKEVMGCPANIHTYSSHRTNTYYIFKREKSEVVFGLFGSMFHEISFKYNGNCKLIGQLIPYTDEEIKNITDNIPNMPDHMQKITLIEEISADGRKLTVQIVKMY